MSLIKSGQNGALAVFELRGELVMLASDVADAFGVETRAVVQAIRRNPVKLTSIHAFEVSEVERDRLRSLGVISNPGRGGSRALPWVLTRKGVVRLATIMESPKALDATDLIIDVFVDVVTQVAQGSEALTITAPSRLAPSDADVSALAALRKRIALAIENLLETKIDTKSGATVRDELSDIGNAAITHIKELLRSRKVSNEKIEAEALLIIEQTRDLYERRQADLAGAALDREAKALANFDKKIAIVEKLIGMMNTLEPNAIIGMLPAFTGAPKRLPPPDDD